MTLYTRPQLTVLLVVVVVAGIGLGVGHWRRTHPEIAARLESFDLTSTPGAPTTGATSSGMSAVATAPRSPAESSAQSGPGPSTQPGPESSAQSRPESAAQSAPRIRPPKSAPPPQPLDVNRATEDELRTLPGIGGVLAARIVEVRERDGPFASLDDLRRVPGLGRAKLERIASAVALPR